VRSREWRGGEFKHMGNLIINRDLNNLDRGLLLRLLEYCKYLYEEEKERTSRIEKKIDVFRIYLGGGILLYLLPPIDKVHSSITSGKLSQLSGIVLIIFYSLSLIMFVLSFVFTVLTYKVQKFERPADPTSVIRRSLDAKDENDFISTIIADYSVAATRNHEVNEKKAAYLGKSLLLFFLAVISMVVNIVLFKVLLH